MPRHELDAAERDRVGQRMIARGQVGFDAMVERVEAVAAVTLFGIETVSSDPNRDFCQQAREKITVFRRWSAG